MSGAWVKLVTEDQLAGVVQSFERAVKRSFATDLLLVSVHTRSEERRRVEMCARIFEQLRVDAGWSLQRIEDELPRLLRCELDGTSWTVDSRNAWAPESG